MLAAAQLVLAFAARDKEGLVDALKDSAKETALHLKAKAQGKLADQAARNAEAAFKRLRDAMVTHLQRVSRRSGKHFRELIDAYWRTAKAAGRAAGTVLQVLLTPSRITPEWCGLYRAVDQAQQAALTRLLGNPPLPALAPPAPPISLRPR